MSTLAIDGSDRLSPSRLTAALRFADLGLLVVALIVFLVAGFPMLGYAVAAVAWLVARGIQLAAERHARTALASGNRRSALGAVAFARMGRVWLVALAVLLVGVAEREAGLAAAVLSVVLFTVYLAGQGIAHVLSPEGDRR
ncbi:MAG TPA: hypothetical protein VIL53_03660 [Solirubrobacterales bacterium]